MNRETLFEILRNQSSEDLLQLLSDAWECMSTNQRSDAFGELMTAEQYSYPASAEKTLNAVKVFQESSLDGSYYAPFMVNSKNFMDIPEETDTWLAKLEALLIESTKLVSQKEYQVAMACFDILYELFGSLGEEEIIFADELGPWMFTGDEKSFYTAYIQAAAAVCSNEEFVEKALFALNEDRDRSYRLKLYSVIKSQATARQMEMIDEQVRAEKSKRHRPRG